MAKASQRWRQSWQKGKFKSKMLTMGEDKTILEALLDGMQKLNGVENIHVSRNEGYDSAHQREFTSGGRQRSYSVETICAWSTSACCLPRLSAPSPQGAYPIESSGRVQELAPPNDLRHAMFCLYSAPLASMSRGHRELRKRLSSSQMDLSRWNSPRVMV